MTIRPLIAYAILDKTKHLKILDHSLPLFWYRHTAEKLAGGNKVAKVRVSFEVRDDH